MEFSQHPVFHIVVFGRNANTDLDPRELVGTEILNDALKSVVTARGTAAAYAQLANGERNVIRDDKYVFWWDFIKLYRLDDRIA